MSLVSALAFSSRASQVQVLSSQLVEQGPVQEVLENPQHDYTKRLMADVPLLHGRKSMLMRAN